MAKQLLPTKRKQPVAGGAEPASASATSNSSHAYRVVAMFLLVMISVLSIFGVGFQIGRTYQIPGEIGQGVNDKKYSTTINKIKADVTAATARTTTDASSDTPISYSNTLGIPQGVAKALPSIQVHEEEEVNHELNGVSYGGKGDKQHLGGFTKYDGQGVSPSVWRYIIEEIGAKSILDVGCGKGVSTYYFLMAGIKVLCLEGSHDAVEKTLLPDPATQVVEHDFSRGPYWPEETYDVVWSIEFLEHVGRNFQHNYIQAFRKAALIFVSHSQWGGWHHVEVHQKEYWISRFQLFGFTYSELLTQKTKDVCLKEKYHAKENRNNASDTFASIGPDGEAYDAQHIWLNVLVFINPAVASLPKHAHLLAEPGCPDGRDENGWKQRYCDKSKGETELPESYMPFRVTPDQHNQWLAKIKSITRQQS